MTRRQITAALFLCAMLLSLMNQEGTEFQLDWIKLSEQLQEEPTSESEDEGRIDTQTEMVAQECPESESEPEPEPVPKPEPPKKKVVSSRKAPTTASPPKPTLIERRPVVVEELVVHHEPEAPEQPKAREQSIDEIGRIIEAERFFFKSCYKFALSRHGVLRQRKMQGVVKVRFVIKTNGRIDQFRIVENPVDTDWLPRCLETSFRSMRFDRRNEPLVVNYPVNFYLESVR